MFVIMPVQRIGVCLWRNALYKSDLLLLFIIINEYLIAFKSLKSWLVNRLFLLCNEY